MLANSPAWWLPAGELRVDAHMLWSPRETLLYSVQPARRRTEALRCLQIHNPELYSKVVNQHFVVGPIQYRKDWLESKYPPLKPESNIETVS